MPGYEKYKKNGNDFRNLNAEYLSLRGVTLPSHYKINQKQIEAISSCIVEFIKKN